MSRKFHSVFEQFESPKPELKNIFARIPQSVRDDFDFICGLENKSVYAGVEAACRLLIKEFRQKNPGVKLPSDSKPPSQTKSA